MKDILLLGANGFLGNRVEKRLYEDNYKFSSLYGKDNLDLTNYDSLDNFLKKNSFKKIINCAAFVGGISYGDEYKIKLFNINNLINKNIYQSASNNNISQIINPISNCAYPKYYEMYSEENFWNGEPDESVYSYGMAKRNQVILSKIYKDKFSISTSSLIFSNMYGPGDYFEEKRSHALGSIIGKVSEAKKSDLESVTLWGSGTPKREWLYVDDAVEAILKTLTLNEQHIFTNVGIGKSISIIELSNLIKKLINWEGEFVFDLSKKDGVNDKKVNPKTCLKVFNWLPGTNLETGIKLTLESLK